MCEGCEGCLELKGLEGSGAISAGPFGDLMVKGKTGSRSSSGVQTGGFNRKERRELKEGGRGKFKFADLGGKRWG